LLLIVSGISAYLFLGTKAVEEQVAAAPALPAPLPAVPEASVAPEVPQLPRVPVVAETPPAPVGPPAVPVSQNIDGFVVLAPVSAKELVYVEADIEIAILGGDPLERMKKEEPYFRDIVHKVISAVISGGGGAQIQQEVLQKKIMEALNGAFASTPVNKVVFTKFVIG
jgi:flagellar basal body-associated protein FliL